MGEKILYKDLSYKICGLFFKTHNDLGRFHNEKIYADYLENLLKNENISYIREKPLKKTFEGEKCGRNIPDFIIENEIIVDLKAKSIVSKEDYYQMKRYLASSKIKLGLIVNFRQNYIHPKRILGSPL